MTYGCQSCSVVGVQHDELVLLFVYRVTGAMMTYGCQSCSVVGVQHDELVLLFVYRVTPGAMMTYGCQSCSVVGVQHDKLVLLFVYRVTSGAMMTCGKPWRALTWSSTWRHSACQAKNRCVLVSSHFAVMVVHLGRASHVCQGHLLMFL